MDYISKAALMGKLTSSEEQQKIKAMSGADAYNEFLTLVNDTEKADVAPVRHGEWAKTEDDWHSLTTITCSECHEEWCFEIEEDVELLNYRYCPNCGARMDLGGADDGERYEEPMTTQTDRERLAQLIGETPDVKVWPDARSKIAGHLIAHGVTFMEG